VRFRVAYQRPQDLVADYDQQILRGGLLVRVEPPAGLNQFDAVELELVVPNGSVVLAAEVMQVFAGVGVAVAFSSSDIPEIAQGVENARAHPAAQGEPPRHSIELGGPSGRDPSISPGLSPESSTPPAASAPSSDKGGGNAEKIQRALHGTKDERAAILRDLNKTLHPYVLRNPGLQLDEVLAMSKMATLAPEVLKAIADKREWAQRPDIAIALVRNVKTPIPIALKLLDFVSAGDLRQLAKDTRTRDAIQHAARKKVVG
jgi:hypothetical protein